MSPIAGIFSGVGPLTLFIAKATVLLIAAIVATFALRSSTAGARHLVWLAALVGVLALPLISRIEWLQLGLLPSALAGAPAQEIPGVAAAYPQGAPTQPTYARAVGPSYRGAAAPEAPAEAGPSIITIVGSHSVVRVMPAPRAKPFTAVAPTAPISYAVGEIGNDGSNSRILEIVAAVWAVVALILLGWLAAGALTVRRIVAGARELTTPDWTTPLCEVADRLDLELPPRLVMSDRIEMAFACRAFSPTIVLPEGAESWSDERRRAVLFHELAHVKRHDLVGHLLARLACALYWFHPLVWTAAKNLRAESERACDDLVLSCGARPSDYAQHLLDMVTSVRNFATPVLALPMARKKEFEGRMLAILDPDIRRASPGRLQTIAVIVALAALSVTVAAVSPANASESEPLIVAPAVNVEAPAFPAGPTIVIPGESNQVSVRDTARETSLPVPDQATGLPTFKGVQQGALDSAKVAMLIRVLSTDSDADVRRTAAWALNEAQTVSAATALVKALRQDANPSVREMSAWALSERSGEEVLNALGDALIHDSSASVRQTAAWALGQLEAHEQVSLLERALVDSANGVRQTAAWALGQMDLKNAPRSLTNLLTDSSSDVRLVTAWALGQIEDRTTVEAIVSAYQTETRSDVRSAELRALAAMDAAPASIVEAALKSDDPELRRRAVAMLAGSNGGAWVWPWPWPQPRPMP